MRPEPRRARNGRLVDADALSAEEVSCTIRLHLPQRRLVTSCPEACGPRPNCLPPARTVIDCATWVAAAATNAVARTRTTSDCARQPGAPAIGTALSTPNTPANTCERSPGRGIGRRAVSNVSDVAETTIVEIVAGRKTKIRARTERALLAVDDASAADGARVSATGSWRLLNELLEDGYTKAFLATRLGRRTPSLQVGEHQVTVRTRHDIERLHAALHFLDAGESIRCLRELRSEGYRATRIEREIADLAAAWSLDDMPSLTPRRGRLHHVAVRLIAVMHSRLTA